MGVGLGGAPVAFALYLELVPSKYRGALLVALQSFWTVGSMLEVRHVRGFSVSCSSVVFIMTAPARLCCLCKSAGYRWRLSQPGYQWCICLLWRKDSI